MKTWIIGLIITLAGSSAVAQKYSYKFKIKGIADTTIYMANYYGKKQYYNDTAQVNSKGEFTFEGNKPKPGGIYSVIMPDKKSYLELIINNESSFSVVADSKDLIGTAKFTDSKENEAFYEYMRYVTELQKTAEPIRMKLQTAQGDEKDQLLEQQNSMQTKAEEFRQAYLNKYSDLFAATVLKLSKDPEVPEEAPTGYNSADSTWQYKWFKNNYLNDVDFKDERLLRTPILHKKIEYYITKLTPQVPDSICSSIDHLIGLSGDTGLVFKYIVQFSTNKYERSKVMGMDAVFVCMAEKYYVTGKATWVDSTQLKEIKESYEVRKNLILGKKAEDIVLIDTAGTWKSLHGVDAKYTVLVFWDPNCGHCKKEIPKLARDYEQWKEEERNIEVFAASTDFENKDWIKFVKDKNLTFINVSDSPEINENAWKYIQAGNTTLNSLNFRDYWDIFSTPQFYLLDENKTIIAKRLSSDQIIDFIESYEKRNQ